MKLPNGLISFLVTIGCYLLFFTASIISGGDESTNPAMGAAAAIAMTFFINFPIAWFVIHRIVKEIRNR